MGEAGFYEPSDINNFWVHFYDRTVLKPYKFKNNSRYANGGGWEELILWGNRIGVYPRIKSNLSLWRCRRIAKKHVSKKA